jgi:hypothetical protein
MLILILTTLLFTSTTQAADATAAELSNTTTIPNLTDASDTHSALGVPSIVGSIPYSNQWTYEEPSSYIYLVFNHQNLARKEMRVGQYSSAVSSDNLDYPSIDYFVRIFRLGDRESKDLGAKFGLWTRYSLGASVLRDKLKSSDFTLSSTSETGYFGIGFIRLGPVLVYEAAKWIAPYFGGQIFIYGYRHTASISGAETQDGGSGLEPVVGAHFPVLFNRRVSAYGEVRYSYPFDKSKTLLESGTSFDAGLGMAL